MLIFYPTTQDFRRVLKGVGEGGGLGCEVKMNVQNISFHLMADCVPNSRSGVSDQQSVGSSSGLDT